jgi:phospholipid/cholesterol/gamma-HCH transport system substrate-binding protein
MTQSRRNMLVGLTVIGSLSALGWMLLRFGSAPAKLFHEGKQIQVRLISDRADGLSAGSGVTYLGVPVGRVTSVRRDDNAADVIIDALIDDVQPLPANLQGIIKTESLLSGQAVIALEVAGVEPATTQGTLSSDQVLRARYVGSEVIPHQFAELATALEKTTHDLQDAQLISHLDQTVRSADDVLKSLQDYVGDPKLKDDIRISLDNFREVTESAKRSAENVEKFSNGLQKISDQANETLVAAHQTIDSAHETVASAKTDLDQTTKQVNDRLLQMNKILENVQSITAKIDNGTGTTGQLVNDPKLYQSMVDSARELNLTITDLRRLVDQWEQEGATIKLK